MKRCQGPLSASVVQIEGVGVALGESRRTLDYLTGALEITYCGELIWREPPVILDAKYYLAGSDPTSTHEPIKKLLGDMVLLEAQMCMLFFPLIAEPADGEQITRTISHTDKQYIPHSRQAPQMHLYHLEPSMALSVVQARLRSALEHAAVQLPERSEPICQGVMLDPNTINADQWKAPAHTVLCRKAHIGPGIYDLVNAETDCLKNPGVCHVMGQAIVSPFVARATTKTQPTEQS